FLAQLDKPVDDHLRRADDDLVAQRVIIADRLQSLATFGALLDGTRPGAGCRGFQLFAEPAVEIHDAFLGFFAGPRASLGDVERQAQIHPAVPGVAGRLVGLAVDAPVRPQLRQGGPADSAESGQTLLTGGRKAAGSVEGAAALR